MNKIHLIITYLIFYLYTGISLASPQQGNWRWRNDDGDVYSATWKDSVNTPVVLINYENIRLRIECASENFNISNISLGYSENCDYDSWIPITRTDTGKFFITQSLYLIDTASYSNNQLLPQPVSWPWLVYSPTYRKTITFDYSDNYLLIGDSCSLFELEYSVKPTMKIQPGSAYFFCLYDDDGIMYQGNSEYPVLMTPPVNWVTNYSGTTAYLYDVSFFDASNGIAVGGRYG